jgi:hypothetical protein
MLLTGLKNVNLLVAFLLELCVLVALGYWGFQTGQGMALKIILGLGAPILAIVVWGMFGAPRSSWQLQGIWYWLLKVVFFGSAIVALFVANQRTLGVAFALVFVLNSMLIYIWKQ